jgi:hypothetical protein
MGVKAFPAKVRSGFASGQCVNIKAFPAKVRSGFASGQCVNIKAFPAKVRSGFASGQWVKDSRLVNGFRTLIIIIQNIQNFAQGADQNIGQRIKFLTQHQSRQI